LIVPVPLILTSDTHLPRRARDLFPRLWTAIEAADVIVHAGDWIDVALLDELKARSRRLLGVYGNNDHGPLRERLHEVVRAEIGASGTPSFTRPVSRRDGSSAAVRFPDADVLAEMVH
jgi:putative phosphoesterase